MRPDQIHEVLSSQTRLKIAGLVARRPRTLKELSDLTGVSVQGVLKHIAKLKALGLVAERKIDGVGVSVHKVYTSTEMKVVDHSAGDLFAVKLVRSRPLGLLPEDPLPELEALAEQDLIQRRRIREQARRLGRMIDEAVSVDARIEGIVEGLDLDGASELMIKTLLTEGSLEEAGEVLRKSFGAKSGRRSIEKAIAAARSSAKKQKARNGHKR
ncbi:MAG: winged helix-turn-helix transcriptional regulator [archaeon]|nr:MAG: winged helix-turn-helix transcriptional regulator [archaeon]